MGDHFSSGAGEAGVDHCARTSLAVVSIRNKCIASSNKCLASSNKCLTSSNKDATSCLAQLGRHRPVRSFFWRWPAQGMPCTRRPPALWTLVPYLKCLVSLQFRSKHKSCISVAKQTTRSRTGQQSWKASARGACALF